MTTLPANVNSAKIHAGENVQGASLGNPTFDNVQKIETLHIGCYNTQTPSPESNKVIPLWRRFWIWSWDNEQNNSGLDKFLIRFRRYVTIRFVLLIILFGGLTLTYLKLKKTCWPGPVRRAILIVLWIVNLVFVGHRLSFYIKILRKKIIQKLNDKAEPVKYVKENEDNTTVIEKLMQEDDEQKTLEKEDEKDKDKLKNTKCPEKADEEDKDKLKILRAAVQEQVKEEFCIVVVIALSNLLTFAVLMAYNNKKCISALRIQFLLGHIMGYIILVLIFLFGEIVKYLICKSSNRTKVEKFYIWTVVETILLIALIICTALTTQTLKKDVLRDRIINGIKEHCIHDSRLDFLGSLSFPISSSGLLKLRLDELHGDTHTRLYKKKETNVNIENLLKLGESQPCTHTIIEGDTFSGKLFLARKICYEFATNDQSVYHKNFDFILEISLLNVKGKPNLKDLILAKLKSLAGADYKSFETSNIEIAIRLERILFIITDVPEEEHKSMVEVFIDDMEETFPNSSSLVFLDPFEFINTKLTCLYKVTGIKPETRKQLLHTLTSEKCAHVIEKIIEQRSSRYNEEYHLGQMALLAASCERLTKTKPDVRTVLNNYVEIVQERCNFTGKEFSLLIQYAFNSCLKGKECNLAKSEIARVMQKNEQTFLVLRNCGLLAKVQKRGGQLLYRVRKSLLLFAIVKFRNEELNTSQSDLDVKSLVKATLNRDNAHPIRAFISDYPPMLCLYGGLAEILFCVDGDSTLRDGYFLTQGEAPYVYLNTTMLTARYPLSHKDKWPVTVNSHPGKCNNELRKTNLDPNCTEKGYETSRKYPTDEDEASQFFLSSRNCVEHCRLKQYYIFKTEKQEEATYTAARFRYEFTVPCPESLSPKPYLFVNKLASLVTEPSNLQFLSMEWTDNEFDVPSRILHVTYYANQGIKMLICKRHKISEHFVISEICNDLNLNVIDKECVNDFNELFLERTIQFFSGTIIANPGC